MNLKTKWLCMVLLTVGCLATLPAYGAILPPGGWAGADSLIDPLGDQAEDSRDIVGLYYKYDAGTHFFRMDIAGAPEQVGGQFAAEYFLQFDAIPGGGTAADSSYIAESLLGIDALLGSHFTVAGGWTVDHLHAYIGPPAPAVNTVMLASLGGYSDFTEGGGTILQWAVPGPALPPGSFTVYGTTMDISVPSTFDTTAGLAVTVPEPTILTLLAAGVIGLFVLRRVRRR
ncbi:MAG: PEP-CTERM sorting domain-containing protein [Planctomycetia bacterium]